MWGYIGLGICAAALAVYIGVLRVEVDHYKTAAAAQEAKYNLYVQESNATNAALKQAADAITSKYSQALVQLSTAEESKNVAIQQRIKSDQALNAIKLSADAISVFNDGKQTTGQPDGKGASTTVSGDAKAGDTSLADLLSVVKVNEQNQNECVDRLGAWQSFWQDYETAVEKVGG